MINKINFLGQIHSSNDLQNRQAKGIENKPDSFTSSPEGKKAQTVRKAKERIIEELEKLAMNMVLL